MWCAAENKTYAAMALVTMRAFTAGVYQNWPAGVAAIHQKLLAGWFVLDEVTKVYVGSIKRTSANKNAKVS